MSTKPPEGRAQTMTCVDLPTSPVGERFRESTLNRALSVPDGLPANPPPLLGRVSSLITQPTKPLSRWYSPIGHLSAEIVLLTAGDHRGEKPGNTAHGRPPDRTDFFIFHITTLWSPITCGKIVCPPEPVQLLPCLKSDSSPTLGRFSPVARSSPSRPRISGSEPPRTFTPGSFFS